jgi:glucose/mannose transport system permease protein
MDSRSRIQDLLPKLVLAPSFVIILVFVYGFILYTGVLSLTDSKMLPSYNFAGLSNYSKLWALPHWWRAITNLAIFA